MKLRWMGIALGLIAVLAAGGIYYTRSRAGAPTQSRGAQDPALVLLFALRILDRQPETQLTKEQIATILPFIKALKDIPASDAQAIQAIVETVRNTFTPQQKVALEEARRLPQERRSGGVQVGSRGSGQGFGGGGGAPGGPPAGGHGGVGGGQGLTDEQRQQFRARAFDRMIRDLARRMQ